MSFTPTIAVDFDGVIHTYDKGWHDGTIYGDLMPGAIEALTFLMSRYAVFVHTTRNPDQVARWIEDRTGHGIECTTRMRPFLPSWWKWGRKHTFWNRTGVLLVTDRKLPAVAYIDDRAVHHVSWQETMRELTDRGYEARLLGGDT